jgi:hypothetical protein
MLMEWDYVSELRPLTGLLFIPRIIYKYVEPRWNDTDRRRPNTVKNLSHYHFVHHKFHTDANKFLRGERPAAKSKAHLLSFQNSLFQVCHISKEFLAAFLLQFCPARWR